MGQSVADPFLRELRKAMHHRADTYTRRELLVVDRICADIDVVHQRRLAIPMKPLRAEPRTPAARRVR